MRIALDTNILVYAEGVNGADRQTAALKIIGDLAEEEVVVPAQAFGELFTVLTRKARRTAHEARQAVLAWHDVCLVASTCSNVLFDAMELATSHRFSMWDAIILAAAANSECRYLFSEDMQDGFVWRNVTIRNPFAGHSVSAR